MSMKAFPTLINRKTVRWMECVVHYDCKQIVLSLADVW